MLLSNFSCQCWHCSLHISEDFLSKDIYTEREKKLIERKMCRSSKASTQPFIVLSDITKNHSQFNVNLCQYCEKAVADIDLEKHIFDEHTVKLPHQCIPCTISFHKKEDLNRHMASNHERNHSLQTDLSKENLKDLEKPIEIENSTIIESKISSAKEKSEPRSCKFCQKQFNLRKVLNDHVTMVHTDFVPYGCEICNQSFRHFSEIKSHLN